MRLCTLRGRWIAQERDRLGLTVRQVAASVGVSTPVLALVERHDRELDLSWLPPLLRLGFDKAVASRVVSGAWLRSEWLRPNLTPAAVAAALGVSARRLIAGSVLRGTYRPIGSRSCSRWASSLPASLVRLKSRPVVCRRRRPS